MPGQVILTPLFEQDFSTVSPADPLDPTSWNVDANDQPEFVGNLQTAADGVDGAVVCELSADTQGADWQFQYWVGEAPDDVFVEATIASISTVGGDTAIVFYRSAPNSVGVDALPGGCYQCSLVVFDNNTAFVVIREGPGGERLFTANNPSLVVQPGDRLMAGAIGNQHFVFYNDALVGTFIDGTFLTGGAGTAGIGITNTFEITGVQFAAVRIGAAAFAPRSSRSK